MSLQVESKHNSTLEAALLAEAPKQWERFQRNKRKREKGKAKWQREIEDIDSKVAGVKTKAEEVRRKYNPELMRIEKLYTAKNPSASSLLVCPVCGELDRYNRMNGKPWCFKCNVAFESPFQVKKGFPNIKVLPKTKRIETTFRRLDE